jgi:hypothetical protein
MCACFDSQYQTSVQLTNLKKRLTFIFLSLLCRAFESTATRRADRLDFTAIGGEKQGREAPSLQNPIKEIDYVF